MVISRFALSLIGPAQVCVVVMAPIWEYIEAELLLLSVLSYSTLLLSGVVWSASIHLNIFLICRWLVRWQAGWLLL